MERAPEKVMTLYFSAFRIFVQYKSCALPEGSGDTNDPLLEKSLKLTMTIRHKKSLKLTMKIRDLGENDPPFKILATPLANEVKIDYGSQFLIKGQFFLPDLSLLTP
jgi:hypothetical protein